MSQPAVVSLFSGAGGLDYGFSTAGFPVVLAVDQSDAAIRTHRRNFPATTSVAANLVDLGPSGVLEMLADHLEYGSRIGIIGGPPCQGFSRANNASRADDPRNELPTLYLQIVALLAEKYVVEFVLFENVLGIRDQKHEETFAGILAHFSDLDLFARVDQYSALDFGVPQTRTRVVISAFRSDDALQAFRPAPAAERELTVRSAIEGLPEPRYFARGIDPSTNPHHRNHWTMQPKSKRFSDPTRLSSTGRTFRRLTWDSPSPTVAYGHREIHVHPRGHRRLSIYEAMLLQGFPHEFVLEGTLSDQVEQVSNAVPPPLASALAQATKAALDTSRTESSPR